MGKLDKLYKFKSKESQTANELYDKYSYKRGFNVGMVHDQFITDKLDDNDITSGYVNTMVVSKMRGEYPNFEREPKFKGLIFDRYKKFVEVERGKFVEVEFGS